MKVVILTENSIISRFAVNRLVKENDYFIVVEKGRPWHLLFKKFRRFIRKEGLFKGILLCFNFVIEMPFVLQENKKTANYLKEKLKESRYYYPVIKIDSVNNPKIIKIVDKINPDIIIDIGTDIVKKDIIDSLKNSQRYFINWHIGITPKYRGCQSEFWAIYSNNPDEIGSTIHHLDKGVDTGKIILQKRVKLEPFEKQFQYDYRFMRYKNILLGVELLNRFLAGERGGGIEEMNQVSCFLSTPSKKEYKEYYRRFKEYV